MTSNIGSQYILDVAGDDSLYEEMRSRVMDTMRHSFRPEFLNRIDETIIFLNLKQEQIGKIVDIQMQHLAGRLAEQNIELILSDSARDLIAREGYDPIYGARPLKRVIQRQIENPLAMEILEGKIAEGDRISAETDGDQVIFRKAYNLKAAPL
jgi:ATP-dependent Clp protease ATP-binding subunit ClpB